VLVKWQFVAAALTLALLVLAWPATAGAAPAQVHTYRGKTVVAHFADTAADGCITTEAQIWYSEQADWAQPGAPGVGPAGHLFIRQHDACTGTLLLFADDDIAGATFRVSPDLRDARLAAAVALYDRVSASKVAVAIDLAWAGSGALVRATDHYHTRVPFIVNGRSAGAYRAATASGSITAGATTFTPRPSVFAEVQSVTSGVVVLNDGD